MSGPDYVTIKIQTNQNQLNDESYKTQRNQQIEATNSIATTTLDQEHPNNNNENNNNRRETQPVSNTPTPEKSFDWKKWAKIAAMVVAVAVVVIGVLALLTGFSILLPGAIPALAAFIVGGLTIAAGTALFVGSAYSLRNQLLAETTRRAERERAEREEVQEFVEQQDAALSSVRSVDDFNSTDYAKISKGRRQQILRAFKNKLEQLSQEEKLIAVLYIHRRFPEMENLDEEARAFIWTFYSGTKASGFSHK